MSRVLVTVQKLSSVVIKKHMEQAKYVSVPINKKLFREVPAESKNDSSEDDIIQSLLPLKKEFEQTRSKQRRRSLSKLEMEVKQRLQKELSRGEKNKNLTPKKLKK